MDNSGEMWFILAKALAVPERNSRRRPTSLKDLQRVEKVATRTKEARDRLQMMVKRAEARRAAVAKS